MLKMTNESEITHYYDGIVVGVMRYAYWKDGVQYVGTTGKTLKKALEEINISKQDALKNYGKEHERVL